MPSLRALGFFGSLRRALSKPLRVLFCGGCGKKSDAGDNMSPRGGAAPDVPA
jgi:hypothetical protein